MVLAFTASIGLALVAQDLEAARLGGGRSFGRQSQSVTRQQAAPAPSQATQPAQAAPAQSAQRPGPAQPQPAGNRWLGPLAGLAAGLGIAALLSHFGMGPALASAMGSMLLIALLVIAGVFVWRMLRGSRNDPATARRMEPAYASNNPGNTYEPERPSAPVNGYSPLASGAAPGSVASLAEAPGAVAARVPWGVPADFDVEGFLRNAKVYYIRLQTAWDANNLNDIREFTTPEVFAEIKMQIDERKGAQNKTDVVNLNAELLGIETTDTEYLASVRFDGTLRDNDAAPAPFEEVWNLSKPVQGRGGWLLAGIQQLH